MRRKNTKARSYDDSIESVTRIHIAQKNLLKNDQKLKQNAFCCHNNTTLMNNDFLTQSWLHRMDKKKKKRHTKQLCKRRYDSSRCRPRAPMPACHRRGICRKICVRVVVRGGARGAFATTEIWEWVRRTPPQSRKKHFFYEDSNFTNIGRLYMRRWVQLFCLPHPSWENPNDAPVCRQSLPSNIADLSN